MINLKELTIKDKGKEVSYKGYVGKQYGTISHWDSTHVFVEYTKGNNPIPTLPKNLTFITKEVIEEKQ